MWRPLRHRDYFALGGVVGAALMAAIIGLFSGGGKEEEDISNVMYKGQIQNSHVTYTHNGELERLIDKADGVTWDIGGVEGGWPERATRTEGSNPPSHYGEGRGPDVPKNARELLEARKKAIEAKRNAELEGRYNPPAPEPATPDPATTPAPTPATPAPAPAPTTPGPAPDPAAPAAPDATSAIYSRTNYRA